MFVARAPYQLVVPPGLAQPGEQYWRLFELPSSLPWFLATVRFNDDEVTFQRTFCLCWESDVVEMLTAVPGATAVSLQLVQPPFGGTQGWSIRSIARLWRLRKANKHDERPYFVLEGTDGACLCPMSGASLEADLEEREVIVDLT